MTSARPDGATSLAVGLAAVLSGAARTLLIDLNRERPELAPMLDVDDGVSVYHLAYQAQLQPVGARELEDAVRWHEGLGVLPGIADAGQAALLSDHFVSGLLRAARESFPQVVVDGGRLGLGLPAALTAGVLCVVAPTPLGLVAVERCLAALRAAQVPWLESVRVVINQVTDDSLRGVAEFLSEEHRLPVLGSLPFEPGFWRRLELTHSLQALSLEPRDERRYARAFGAAALRTRRALEQVVRGLQVEAPVPAVQTVEA